MGNIRTKYRYKFLNRASNKSQTKEEELSLRREIQEYRRELKNYDIDLAKLCKTKTNQSIRDRILNIALSLIKDDRFKDNLLNKEAISTYDISKSSGISTRNVKKYRNYITAYMVLFFNEDYAHLRSTLEIGTDFDNATSNIKQSNQKKGIKLNEYATSNAVLTSDGEFLYLDSVASNTKQGQLVTGVESIVSPHRIKTFVVVSIILILAFIAASAYYYKVNKTIHILGTSTHVEMSYNTFNRLIGENAYNINGQALVTNTAFSNRKLSTSIAEILDSGLSAGYFSQGSTITMNVTLGDFPKEVFQADVILNVIRKYGVTLKINLNNSNFLIIK